MILGGRNIENVYLIGIGGIGMSALALYFKRMELNVEGYDRVESRVTKMLEEQGIKVYFEEDKTHLSKFEKAGLLVVYTPAIPDTHKELRLARIDGYFLKKRSEVLGILSNSYKTIAVGGTHGKTTVTSMIAHIFKSSGEKAVVFSGGIMENYGTNFLYEDNAEYMIVEADEYDRSFLQLKNNYINIVTAVDADHLDIYGDYENLLAAFNEFLSSIDGGGTNLVNEKVNHLFKDIENKKTYGFKTADFTARNIDPTIGKFDFYKGDELLFTGEINVLGTHNIENAVAASSVSVLAGISPEKIKEALASFKGNWRRFEVIYNDGNKVYIDDYAHHPQEIESVLSSVRNIWKDAKVLVVFQPHLFSRTRDLADDFAKVLAMADDIVLLPIYPAREEPLEGINSEWLLSKIDSKNKFLVQKDELTKFLQTREFDVLLTLGAGDIDRLVEPVRKMLLKRSAV